MTNEFENLPLAQVELKVTLPAPVILHTHNILAAANSMSGRYTGVQPDAQYLLPPGIQDVPDFPNTVQYIRFIDPERSFVATLHSQMIGVAWTDLGLGIPYPRFDVLLKELSAISQEWELTKELKTFPVAQISYANFIASEDPRDLWFLNEEVLKINFPSMIASQEFQLSFRVEKADVRLVIQAASKISEGKPISGFSFQTIVGSSDMFDSWKAALAHCHDRSNELFSIILSAKAKTEWGHKL